MLLGAVGTPAAFTMFAGVCLNAFSDFGLAEPIVVGLLSSLIGAFLCSFVLTVWFPASSDTGLSVGFTFMQIPIGGLCAMDVGLPGFVGLVIFLGFLVLSVVAYGSGRFGVTTARRYGPQWCRIDSVMPPEESMCPACGYVLYFAEGQKCPDCGRVFHLDQVDMRRAQWDGYVLRPWPATADNTKSALHT